MYFLKRLITIHFLLLLFLFNIHTDAVSIRKKRNQSLQVGSGGGGGDGNASSELRPEQLAQSAAPSNPTAITISRPPSPKEVQRSNKRKRTGNTVSPNIDTKVDDEAKLERKRQSWRNWYARKREGRTSNDETKREKTEEYFQQINEHKRKVYADRTKRIKTKQHSDHDLQVQQNMLKRIKKWKANNRDKVNQSRRKSDEKRAKSKNNPEVGEAVHETNTQ